MFTEALRPIIHVTHNAFYLNRAERVEATAVSREALRVGVGEANRGQPQTSSDFHNEQNIIMNSLAEGFRR